MLKKFIKELIVYFQLLEVHSTTKKELFLGVKLTRSKKKAMKSIIFFDSLYSLVASF
jgi:hypothetical protein